jgi:DNA polymerase/3'-5' exonuclease PolX
MTACESLTAYPKRVKSGEEALQLDGVGYKLSRKIQEILDTGHLKELEAYQRDPHIQAVNELCQVYGVGASKANILVHKGITSIEQLKKEPLTKKQQIGMKYLEDFKHLMTRKEVEKHFDVVKSILHDIDPNMIVECVGSYRRGEDNIKMIDILIANKKYTHQNDDYALKVLKQIQSSMEKKKYLVEVIASGAHQIIGVVRLPKAKDCRRFEIKLYPMDSFYTGLLNFTGSHEFIRQMRRIAKNRGYKLSEYYLAPRHSLVLNRKSSRDYKVGEPVKITSEKDIFDILEIPYREPHDRSL